MPRYSKEQIRNASLIKAIFFDVDGVLTDGRIIYDDAGREVKSFNVKDGLIIGYLKKAGINAVFYESPRTAHEFLTWRRCLREFAPLLFNMA